MEKKNIRKLEEKVGNKSNEIIINLTSEERKHLRVLLLDLGLIKTQIELLFAVTAVGNGRVDFITTFNEIAKKLHTDAPETRKERKSRNDSANANLTDLAENRQKKGKSLFSMEKRSMGMNPDTGKPNPMEVRIKLLFLIKLVNITNEGITDVKAKFERLRESLVTE